MAVFDKSSDNPATDYINSYHYGNQTQQPYEWMRLPYDEFIAIKRADNDILARKFICSLPSIHYYPKMYEMCWHELDEAYRSRESIYQSLDLKLRQKFISTLPAPYNPTPYGITPKFVNSFFTDFPEFQDQYHEWKGKILDSMEKEISMPKY